MNNEKEFLYVGCYLDENDDFILKVGTTNNLERRRLNTHATIARPINIS